MVKGNVEAGERVSGLELGLRNGDVELVGVVGIKLGMVGMGVVISLWTVEIDSVNCCFPWSCPSTFTCPVTSFTVLLEPVFEMTMELLLFCPTLSKACEESNIDMKSV